MKKFILLIVSIISVYGISAQNNLSVFSEDGHPFYLILNGIRQNVNPETNVRVSGLPGEYYSAKVIFADAALGEIEKKTLMVSGIDCVPCDVVYKIKADKNGAQVMKAFSFTNIAVAPPPPPNVAVVQYNTVPMPAPIMGVQVTETTTTTTNGYSENVNMGINVGGFNMGVNVNVNDGYGGSSQTTTTTTTTVVPAQQTVIVQQPVVVAQPVCPTMTQASYGSLLSSIDKKSFDEDKLTIAKQAISSNCMTTNQIKGIMGAFTWEDSRLDFAKYAYAYCLDQNNYYQVNDAFEWDDSVTKLNTFIGR